MRKDMKTVRENCLEEALEAEVAASAKALLEDHGRHGRARRPCK